MEPTASAGLEPAAPTDLGTHTPMLRRYLATLGARPGQIHDLVQETFVITLQKRPLDLGHGAVAAWLRGVARNLLLRERRSFAARREVELADEVWYEQCGDGDGGELVEAMRACIRQLPPRSREMVRLAYGDGEGRVAIGTELGLVTGGVKTAMRRLRAALKACVERRTRGGP